MKAKCSVVVCSNRVQCSGICAIISTHQKAEWSLCQECYYSQQLCYLVNLLIAKLQSFHTFHVVFSICSFNVSGRYYSALLQRSGNVQWQSVMVESSGIGAIIRILQKVLHSKKEVWEALYSVIFFCNGHIKIGLKTE